MSPIFRFFVCLLAVCCHGVVIAAEDAVVLDIERIYASPDLAGPAPRAVKISPDSTRVSFLRGKESDRQQLDLWEYNLEDSEVRLLVDSQGLIAGPEDVSEEELARRERLRIVGQRGIVSYQFSPDGSALLFPLSSDLFLYEIATRKTRRLTATQAGETDPKFSPDGRYISFVRDRDLYLVDVATGVERRLTRDGGGMVSNGMAEFIAQEEMKRFTGYWWAPDSESIAFTRVDESGVEIAKRFEVYAEEFKVYEQRYPRTGTANAVVRLGVIEVDDGDTRWMNIGENDDVYLARVNWFPGSKYLAVQRQSRDQKTLELLKVEAAGGAASVLLTERSEYWINLHNDLAFLDSAPQFIWSSERSGFKHLYLYGNDGTLVRPLTEGDWEVVHGARNESAILHVDEKEGLVYVSGTLDSPIERNLYAIALDGSAPPRRLSTEPGWHPRRLCRQRQVLCRYLSKCHDAASGRGSPRRRFAYRLCRAQCAQRIASVFPLSRQAARHPLWHARSGRWTVALLPDQDSAGLRRERALSGRGLCLRRSGWTNGDEHLERGFSRRARKQRICCLYYR